MQTLAFLFSLLLLQGQAYAHTTPAERLQEIAKAQHLSEEKVWLSLHYYESSAKGGWKSEVKADDLGKLYFFSENGPYDPVAELAAFVQALEKTAAEAGNDDHPQCRFPARYLWLKSKIPLAQFGISDVQCERYADWRKRIDADSAYLLFAAAFLNSPASMYGHTLLEFGRTGKMKGETLLNNVLAFGADTGKSSGASYLLMGLLGGFGGSFTTVPLYIKIREYNDVESRDLWAYRLRLSPEQLQLLLAHIWEVRSVNFPYYFLGANCSYYLLRLLEVVNPRESLTRDIPAWTIPIDTIRVLEAEGWIGEKYYRPSRATRLLYQRSQLNTLERESAEHLAKADTPDWRKAGEGLASERKVAVLDTAYEYFRFRTATHNLSAEERQHEAFLLSERQKISLPSAEVSLEKVRAEAPEQSHASNRVGLAAGKSAATHFEIFEWRPALHDLLSNPYGLDHYGEQEIFTTRFRVENTPLTAVLESFDLIRIRALSPLDAWMKKPSWRFRLGTGLAKETDCNVWHCFYTRMEVGGGASVSLAPDSESMLFALVGLQTDVGAPFESNYRIGVGPELGLKLKIFPWWRILGEAEWKWNFLGDRRFLHIYSIGQAFALGKRWDLRINVEERRTYREGLVSAFFFY